MKMPSDAVLKKAWFSGETEYARARGFSMNRRDISWLWRRSPKAYILQLRAIARVILEAQGKEKCGCDHCEGVAWPSPRSVTKREHEEGLRKSREAGKAFGKVLANELKNAVVKKGKVAR